MFQYICRGEILTPVRAHLPRWQETTTIRDGVSEGQFFQVLLYQMDADYLNETRKSNFHLEEIHKPTYITQDLLLLVKASVSISFRQFFDVTVKKTKVCRVILLSLV